MGEGGTLRSGRKDFTIAPSPCVCVWVWERGEGGGRGNLATCRQVLNEWAALPFNAFHYVQRVLSVCVSLRVCVLLLPSMTMPMAMSSGGHLPIAIMVYVQCAIKVVNRSPGTHNILFWHPFGSFRRGQGASFLYRLQLRTFVWPIERHFQWLNYFWTICE